MTDPEGNEFCLGLKLCEISSRKRVSGVETDRTQHARRLVR